MPTCVGDAYIARLSMVQAERALAAAQIALLPRLKNSDRKRLLDRWQEIVATSRNRIGSAGFRVSDQIREVRTWLKSQLGEGISD